MSIVKMTEIRAVFVQSDDCFGQEASRFQRKRLQKDRFLPEYRHPRGLHWFCIARMPKAFFPSAFPRKASDGRKIF